MSRQFILFSLTLGIQLLTLQLQPIGSRALDIRESEDSRESGGGGDEDLTTTLDPMGKGGDEREGDNNNETLLAGEREPDPCALVLSSPEQHGSPIPLIRVSHPVFDVSGAGIVPGVTYQGKLIGN